MNNTKYMSLCTMSLKNVRFYMTSNIAIHLFRYRKMLYQHRAYCGPGYQKIHIYIDFVGDNMMKPDMFLFDDELI